MPVTIGEFEVVPAPEATPPTAPQPATPAAAPLEPLDLQRVLQQLEELALRTFAH